MWTLLLPTPSPRLSSGSKVTPLSLTILHYLWRCCLALIGWFKSDLPGSKTHPPNLLKTRFLLLLEPIPAFIGRSGRGYTLDRSPFHLRVTSKNKQLDTHSHSRTTADSFRVPVSPHVHVFALWEEARDSEPRVHSPQLWRHKRLLCTSALAPFSVGAIKKEKQLKKKTDYTKPTKNICM